ncbi:hypothetical protein KBD20_02885 [Candidatus Saccharibacteria bacterium]|nr:hypothetical protein [Candidatus Saccharibacteria bacterium]
MAKAKAKAKKSELEPIREFAQYFTMTAAVMCGVLWALVYVMDSESSSTEMLSSYLVLATMLGGIAMGLLYLAKLLQERK